MRIKIGCRDSREIKGETQVFFNGDSHRIKWVVETGKDQFEKGASTSKFDRHGDRADEEDEDEEQPQEKSKPSQQQGKQDIGLTMDSSKGGAVPEKTHDSEYGSNSGQ